MNTSVTHHIWSNAEAILNVVLVYILEIKRKKRWIKDKYKFKGNNLKYSWWKA